jgi:hypothetical protein
VPRFTPYTAVLALAFLFVAGPVFGAGALLVPAGERVGVVDVRSAVAMSPSRTTRWIAIEIDKVPGSMAWVLPVRAGAVITEVGDAWLDALDVATAPRIVAPRCGDAGPSPLRVVTESRGTLAPSTPSLHRAVLADLPALRAFAASFAFAIDAEIALRVDELVQRGFSLLVLVYGGPSDSRTIRTVRISDDAPPAVSLFLTGPSDTAVPVTAYVFADSRVRLGAGSELEIDGARLAVTQGGASNYAAALRVALLAANGERWAVEAAAHELVFDGIAGPPGASASPALAPTYARWAARADRTDVSDLDEALRGLDPASLWITRASGIVPAHAFGDDLALTRRDNAFQSPFLAASSDPSQCPTPEGGVGGPGGRPTNPGTPPGTDPPLPPREPDPPPTAPRYRGSTTSVGVSCACAPSGPAAPPPGDESCDGSDPNAPPADDCDGSADDSYTDDDSCDGSADSSGGESCDGSTPSSSGSTSSSGSGCSGEPEGDDGCGSGSSSSSSSDECSTARGTGGRRSKGAKPRVSVIVLGLAATALALRRASASAPRFDRREHRIGPVAAGDVAIDGQAQKIDPERRGVGADVVRPLLRHRRELNAVRRAQDERT